MSFHLDHQLAIEDLVGGPSLFLGENILLDT